MPGTYSGGFRARIGSTINTSKGPRIVMPTPQPPPDTPRTNAESFYRDMSQEYVEADFARTLERENAALRSASNGPLLGAFALAEIAHRLKQQTDAGTGTIVEERCLALAQKALANIKTVTDGFGPHYVIVGYNDNRTPCAALTVYAASAGLEAVQANAVGMLHNAGFPQVKSAEAIAWPGRS